jgi:hypothetical protein
MFNIFYKSKRINNLKLFYPDLLILILALILQPYPKVIYNFSFITYYSNIFILVICSILSIYVKLYHWRKLEVSVTSFFLFSINVIILLLYLLAIKHLIFITYNNISYHLNKDDISTYSRYRYLLLSLISVFFIISLIIFKLLGYIKFPLKEEIHRILYTWNASFMGDLCVKIIDLLASSFSFRILFFSLHFIFFYVMRLITLGLLFYCTFYHGDFRTLYI